MKRCDWAMTELAIAYHDTEWGVPLHDDRGLFEFLILEGAQAGLSWETILKKRDAYRKAFDGFEAGAVARYGQRKVRGLLADPGIVRNRLKLAVWGNCWSGPSPAPWQQLIWSISCCSCGTRVRDA